MCRVNRRILGDPRDKPRSGQAADKRRRRNKAGLVHRRSDTIAKGYTDGSSENRDVAQARNSALSMCIYREANREVTQEVIDRNRI